jgi:hypothetical protein
MFSGQIFDIILTFFNQYVFYLFDGKKNRSDSHFGWEYRKLGRSCKKAIIICLLKPVNLNKMSGLAMRRLIIGSRFV